MPRGLSNGSDSLLARWCASQVLAGRPIGYNIKAELPPRKKKSLLEHDGRSWAPAFLGLTKSSCCQKVARFFDVKQRQIAACKINRLQRGWAADWWVRAVTSSTGAEAFSALQSCFRESRHVGAHLSPPVSTREGSILINCI